MLLVNDCIHDVREHGVVVRNRLLVEVLCDCDIVPVEIGIVKDTRDQLAELACYNHLLSCVHIA